MRKHPSSGEDALPSGAPTEHLTLGAMLDELRNLEEEQLRKEDEKQKRKVNHPAEKSKKRAKNSVAHVKSK